LRPKDIRDFVAVLKQSASRWFTTFYPGFNGGMSDKERVCIERLNRLRMGYFRPLVMVLLKVESDETNRLQVLQGIERFIFLAYRVMGARSNYGSSEFYNLARSIQIGEASTVDVTRHLDEALGYAFNDDGSLRVDEFYNSMVKRFREGRGYYGWPAINYLLYEYEQDILTGSRQKKVDWSDLLKPGRDKLSVEHIYPQTPGVAWEAEFATVPGERRQFYNGALGNLLLLSMSINASLQNDAFIDKKEPKIDSDGRKLRNGYSDGSHSEIEVARNETWGPVQIRDRSLRLLSFMERRWNFRFRNDAERDKLLFL
jgi:hypothetical protein